MKKGFTLIEILVAATIIAILVTVGVVSYSTTTRNARDGKRKSDLEQIRQAMEMYRTDNGKYPSNCSTYTDVSSCLTALVSTYIPSLPVDPKATPYMVQLTNPDASSNYYGYCISANLEATPALYVSPCPHNSGYNYSVKNP